MNTNEIDELDRLMRAASVAINARTCYAELDFDKALRRSAPALIEAAREVERLRATVDAQTAIIVGLKVEKAGLEVDVERLRAFVPRWRREDEYTHYLMLDPVALGGIKGPHPGSGKWGAMVDDDEDLTKHPDIETAARAVCARLGIPYVPVETP